MIDIKKAFGSLATGYMIDTLEYFGVSEEVREVCKYMLDNFYYIQEINKEVKPLRGIPQGSSIAPMLYSLAMIRIMEEAVGRILERRRTLTKKDYPGEKEGFKIVIYVDDTMYYNLNVTEIGITEEELAKAGLTIHRQKCHSLPVPPIWSVPRKQKWSDQDHKDRIEFKEK